uniref:Uncharacterized protein n=1 Tax=Oryza barthii TaxID=65489 RepID=A0A0D3FHZ2_9ORYZ
MPHWACPLRPNHSPRFGSWLPKPNSFPPLPIHLSPVCFLALIGLPVFPPIRWSKFGVEWHGGISMAGNASGDSPWFLA